MDEQDVCRYGHQLIPGSEKVVLREVQPDGTERKQEFLLRRHAVDQSQPIHHGLVSVACGHGLKALPPGTPTGGPIRHTTPEGWLTPEHGGESWMRGTAVATPLKCILCVDPSRALEQGNGSMLWLIRPADDSFDVERIPGALMPEWAAPG